MPSWKKVIVSGSDALLNSLYSPSITGSFTGSFFGDGSGLTGVISSSYSVSSSYALSSSYAISASYAATASIATTSFNTADILIYVKNVSGAPISKGKVVRIYDSLGDNPLVTTASYESDAVSANTLGILNETIPNDSFGYAITEGTLIGIDTSAFTAGQLLFLGATGSIVNIEPQAPLHAVRLGQALRVQALVGSMYVRIDNGYELDELHNVLITSGSDGDLLVASGSNDNGKKLYINSKQLTGSYGLTGSLNVIGSITSSLFGTASYVDYSNIGNKPTLISSSAQIATDISGAFVATSASLAATIDNVIATTVTTSSFNSFTGSYSTGSFTGSFTGNGAGLIGVVSSSYAATASYVNILNQTLQVSGALQLNPIQDPDPTGANVNASYFFVSQSGDDGQYNLHYRNHGEKWETHWLEERADTGLVWGGVTTFSGSTIYITPGAGLIINHNASTSSHAGTTPTYVEFGPITASATYITSSQVTYLVIDAAGSLVQQTNPFTTQQYNQEFPLGYIFNFTTSSISSFADARNTTYGQDDQQSQFIKSFGPLKLRGYDITPQTGSLKITVASGTAYKYGGFYSHNPEAPSSYDSPTILTGSLIRAYRDPAAVGGYRAATNAGVPYSDIDPTKWDNGTGTLQTVTSNQWTIQRAYQGVVNGITYVYYGPAVYNSLAEAIQAIATEAFTEAQVSIIALPFIGYIITRGNTTDLSDTANNKIIQAGLFRNTSGASGGGGAATTLLSDLSDVNISGPNNGEALIYSAGSWINGNPTSASYALNATSASYTATASYVNTLTQNVIITGSTSTDLVRITQTGTGNAFVVEDSTNPDSTPFAISSAGNVGIGASPIPQAALYINSSNNYGISSQGVLFGISAVGSTAGVEGSSNGGAGVYGIGYDAATMIGVEGYTDYSEGTGVLSIGGKFTARLSTSNYSVQLIDGTETVAGRFLINQTTDGKANWGKTIPEIQITSAITGSTGNNTSTNAMIQASLLYLSNNC